MVIEGLPHYLRWTAVACHIVGDFILHYIPACVFAS